VIVVPPTLHPDGFQATRSTDEQFLDLLLGDEDLLRAEFDAIIAAEWPGQPPDRPGRGARAERRPGGTRRRRPRAAGFAGWPRPLRIGGWPRQRSPPPATSDKPTTRKAGDFPLLLIHPTRGDCSPRPHVSDLRRLTAHCDACAARAPIPRAGRDSPLKLWARPPSGRAHNHNRLDATMRTQPTDLYAILGLTRHATQAQISHAHRTLLRRYHPDTRTPGDPSQDAVRRASLFPDCGPFRVHSGKERI